VALERVKRNPLEFEMIISDIRMPGMDGIMLAKEIRELESRFKIMLISRFKIMLVTAYEVDSMHSKNLADMSADILLQKPVTPERLVEETRKQLQAENMDKIYVCRQCKQGFVFNLDLQDHVMQHGHVEMDEMPIQ
jgi:CheY-like chemotaxis protein